MRRSLFAGLVLISLPACPSSKAAEPAPLTIENIRVGLPAGPDSTRVRAGAWCPVYVTVKAGSAAVAPDTLRLVVKANDVDETPFRHAVAVPKVGAGDESTLVTYTRPGLATGDIDVQLTTAEGRVVQTRRVRPNAARDVLEPKAPLLVSVGSSSLRPDPAAQDEPDPETVADADSRNLARIETVAQMPDRWFGYDAADVIVLSTHHAEFVRDLIHDETGRREALAEWVRRGGRLVLCAGKETRALVGGDGPETLLKKMPVIGCRFGANPVKVPLMSGLAVWAHVPNDPKHPPLRGLEIADVEILPDQGVTVLVREDRPAPHPALVQASFGLGRVNLIAFDVEGGPFAAWPGRREFWEELQKELNVRSDVVKSGAAPATQPELLNEIQRNLESFQEVPTVSFGWVSLFILFYIALVGPLDYFVLKKVFKRLELTWLTFPATVVLVSATTYFTAFWLKGDALHVKKLDVIDIDLRDNTAVGTTWFAVFSPRIQNLTVGVEPAAPTWVAPGAADRTTVAVLAAPEQGRRAGSAALYPEPYDCAAGATGLEKVPVPVWATRSFTASWAARLGSDLPVKTALRFPRPGGTHELAPLGDLTNNLPVALEGVTLFYRENWYNLGTLEPGETRAVGELFTGGAKMTPDQWFKDDALRPRQARNDFDPAETERTLGVRSIHMLMKQALFYSETERPWRNSGLRQLDQSWRLFRPSAVQNRDEVILVARVGPLHGNAEELTRKGLAPTTLWLGALPGTGERPKLDAFLTQETYVRVYIPVKRKN